MKQLIPVETIQSKIIIIRNEKVILDRDLAVMYEVETKQLKRAVRRNIKRFPSDFMFELTKAEFADLRSQFGTSNPGGTQYLPMAFTEQGVAMLSSVLRSQRAIQVNIAIMRAFVQMRQLLSEHKELREKIEAMEKKYDKNFQVVFAAIKELMEPPPAKEGKKIGFQIPMKEK